MSARVDDDYLHHLASQGSDALPPVVRAGQRRRHARYGVLELVQCALLPMSAHLIKGAPR